MPRTLIFDIGNVLLRWEPQALFGTLLPDAAAVDAFLAEVGFSDWNHQFDGGVPWDEGVATHAARFPHRAELLAAYRDRWHETIVGPVPGMPELLAELKAAGVPLYAITNFSEPKFSETLARHPFLASSFRDIVVSGVERMTKPGPEIFRLCLARNGIAAGEAVFIDDLPKNVAAAEALGLTGIVFTDAATLRRTLRDAIGLPV
ncbi:MAG: HAD family phosphatase [Amaricoccus sp.]|uniref:HAD family hydrolase n=1 Tax=Amaricoccus sp. TaxID=1872485 RepID=UPI0039E28C13